MISILLPTRNRPENIRKCITSIIESCDDVDDIEICSYVDDDDELSIPAFSEFTSEINIEVYQAERQPIHIRLSTHYNVLYPVCRGDIIMYCADDVMFNTKGWDTLVINEFDRYDDKILLVYGKDGFQNEKIATHGFMHRNWIDTIGYVHPPYFGVAYADNWVTDVATKVGRIKYIESLELEHMHPAAGKGEWNQTYLDRVNFSGEDKLYANLQTEVESDVNKLKEFIANGK